MNRNLRARYWLELAGACLSTTLFLLTLFLPNWIELITGAEPDGGGGELEWLIASTLVAITLTCSLLARREWRRAPMADV